LSAEVIVVSFDQGYVCSISVNTNKNFGEQLNVIRPYNAPIEYFLVNLDLGKVAVASMGSIKFFDLKSWVEESQDRIDITKSCGTIT